MTKTVSKSAKTKPATAKPAPKAAPKAKPAKVDPDLITSAKGTTSGPSKLVVVAGAGTVAIDDNKLTKQLTALCKVGGSLAAVQAYLAQHGKAQPALARGVEARINPHSSKAVQDSRATAQPAKTDPKASKEKLPAKVAKDLDPKAAIKLTAKGAEKLKAGGSAGSILNLSLLSKSADVAKAVALGLKKADITYAVKTGTITLG